MNQMIKVEQKQIGNDVIQTVNARDLHAFLESKQDFSTWIKKRIDQYDFVENQDFTRFHKKMEANNATMIEYYVSINMAKELSMVENNDKGKEARRYFIECEKRALQPQFQLPDFTNPAEAAIAWADQWKKRELAEQSVLRLEEKINQDAPKLEVYEAIAEADSGIRITEFARVLSDKNSIGRNKLYSTLREWKILDRNNVPYQRCIEAEWFYVVERPWKNEEMSGINFQVFLTSKGQSYIISRLNKESII